MLKCRETLKHRHKVRQRAVISPATWLMFTIHSAAMRFKDSTYARAIRLSILTTAQQIALLDVLGVISVPTFKDAMSLPILAVPAGRTLGSRYDNAMRTHRRLQPLKAAVFCTGHRSDVSNPSVCGNTRTGVYVRTGQ